MSYSFKLLALLMLVLGAGKLAFGDEKKFSFIDEREERSYSTLEKVAAADEATKKQYLTNWIAAYEEALVEGITYFSLSSKEAADRGWTQESGGRSLKHFDYWFNSVRPINFKAEKNIDQQVFGQKVFPGPLYLLSTSDEKIKGEVRKALVRLFTSAAEKSQQMREGHLRHLPENHPRELRDQNAPHAHLFITRLLWDMGNPRFLFLPDFNLAELGLQEMLIFEECLPKVKNQYSRLQLLDSATDLIDSIERFPDRLHDGPDVAEKLKKFKDWINSDPLVQEFHR